MYRRILELIVKIVSEEGLETELSFVQMETLAEVIALAFEEVLEESKRQWFEKIKEVIIDAA